MLINGIDGIVDEVHEHLLHAIHVCLNVQRLIRILVDDFYTALLNDGAIEVHSPLDNITHVEDVLLRGFVPGKLEQGFHNALGGRGRVDDDGKPLSVLRGQMIRVHEVGKSKDRRELVVELMGYPGGKKPERGELLCLHGLLFHALLGSDVTHNYENLVGVDRLDKELGYDIRLISHFHIEIKLGGITGNCLGYGIKDQGNAPFIEDIRNGHWLPCQE